MMTSHLESILRKRKKRYTIRVAYRLLVATVSHPLFSIPQKSLEAIWELAQLAVYGVTTLFTAEPSTAVAELSRVHVLYVQCVVPLQSSASCQCWIEQRVHRFQTLTTSNDATIVT